MTKPRLWLVVVYFGSAFLILLIVNGLIPHLGGVADDTNGLQTNASRLQLHRQTEEKYANQSFVTIKLNFTVYDGYLKEPRAEEWRDLLCQSKAYLLELIRRSARDVAYVNLHPLHLHYSPGVDMPLGVTILVQATFEDGASILPEDVIRYVESMESDEFLQGYVWQVKPQGLSAFFETARVATQVKISQYQYDPFKEKKSIRIGNIALVDTQSCGETGIYDIFLFFGFLEGRAKRPTQDEVDALLESTENFLTEKLQGNFTKRVQMKLRLVSWNYDANAQDAITIKCTVVVNFVDGQPSVVPHEYVKAKLASATATQKNFTFDYISTVVWKTPPYEQSTFYEVSRVRIQSHIQRFTYPEPVEAQPKALATRHESTSPFAQVNRSVTVISRIDEPITVSDPECKEYLKQANNNSDGYLSITEYMPFVNSMTKQDFEGYPFGALPDVIRKVYESMSSRGEEGKLEIDLWGPIDTGSKEKSSLLTRDDKLCQYFRAVVNDAVSQEAIEAVMINSTVKLYLDESMIPGQRQGDVQPALDLAFQKVIGQSVGPAIETAAHEGQRDLLGNTSRRSPFFIPVESAHVQNLKEVTCHGAPASDKHTCYSAEGKVQVFINGNNAAGLAPNAVTTTEAMLDHALKDGELNKALREVDAAWSVQAMEPPPTEIYVANSAPSEAPRKKSAIKTLAVTTAVIILLLIAIQCGRYLSNQSDMNDGGKSCEGMQSFDEEKSLQSKRGFGFDECVNPGARQQDFGQCDVQHEGGDEEEKEDDGEKEKDEGACEETNSGDNDNSDDGRDNNPGEEQDIKGDTEENESQREGIVEVLEGEKQKGEGACEETNSGDNDNNDDGRDNNPGEVQDAEGDTGENESQREWIVEVFEGEQKKDEGACEETNSGDNDNNDDGRDNNPGEEQDIKGGTEENESQCEGIVAVLEGEKEKDEGACKETNSGDNDHNDDGRDNHPGEDKDAKGDTDENERQREGIVEVLNGESVDNRREDSSDGQDISGDILVAGDRENSSTEENATADGNTATENASRETPGSDPEDQPLSAGEHLLHSLKTDDDEVAYDGNLRAHADNSIREMEELENNFVSELDQVMNEFNDQFRTSSGSTGTGADDKMERQKET
jgi:hypothetical protein